MGKVEDIDARYKNLSARKDVLQRNKDKIEAELEARQRSLKNLLDEARKDGYNPANLKEEIQRAEEVLIIKLDNFETELNEAEQSIEPMMKELKA